MTTKKANTDRCAALTSRNKDCKKNAIEGSQYCKAHQNWDSVSNTTPLGKPKDEDPRQPSTDVKLRDAEEGDYNPVAMQSNPEFQKFEVAKRIAHTLANSNLVPDAYRGRPNDCFVAINMGAEIGLEPFQAIQSIAVIDGKPCLYGDGLIGVVRASPKCEWIKETQSADGKSATCEAKRKGDPNVVKATYSMSDAMLAGIDSKFNWKKHPKRMLQMRARAYCLRDAFPDILKGLGVVEEMDAHEDTPPPIRSYQLPEKKADPIADEARRVFGDSVTVDHEPDDEEITLSKVERAMHQSDTMEQLLKAADMAKHLSEDDAKVARITYKKMRTALLETGDLK